MKKIVIGSTSPVKSAATLIAFKQVFPQEEFQIEGVSAPSGVANQPFSDQDTFRGAANRSDGALKLCPTADYWVGIEGGLSEQSDGKVQVFAWAVVRDRQSSNSSRTGMFYLPPKLAELVKSGLELGEADDKFFGLQNSKSQMGNVGLMTDGVIDRTHYYAQAVVLALVPFKHPEWYAVRKTF